MYEKEFINVYVCVTECEREKGRKRERERERVWVRERERSHSCPHVRTWGSEVLRKPAWIFFFFQHVDSRRELILSGLVSGTFTQWKISAPFTFSFNIPSYRNLHIFIDTISLPNSITQLKWLPLPGIFFLDKLNPGFKIQLTPYTDNIN